MKSRHSKFQIALEVVGLLLMIGLIVFVCIQFFKLPSKIPGHFNAMGEVDRWGNKNELIALTIMGTLLYIFLSVVTFLPQAWGLPVKITDLNRDAVYSCTRSLLIFTKLEIQVIFLYLAYSMVSAQSLSPIFLPTILLVLFGTITYFIIRIIQLGKKEI